MSHLFAQPQGLLQGLAESAPLWSEGMNDEGKWLAPPGLPQLGRSLLAVAAAFGLLVFLFNKIPENLTLISSYFRTFS